MRFLHANRGVRRGIGLGICLALASACADRSSEELNLILISLDTCRADRLASWGGEARTTPALTAFAEEAVVFNDCLAQSGLTAPSHMSLLTGHYVHRHGLVNNRGGIDPPYTLATVLREAGWRTAAFTGHGSLQARHGAATGFEFFESWVGEEVWPFVRDLSDVVPRALSWLEGAGDQRFFLFLHAYDPHAPYWPGEPWRERYAGWYEGALEAAEITHPNEFSRLIKKGDFGREELRYVNDLYDGELAEADAVFADLIDGLRERGLLDRSIVVFTSDHGEALGEHGWVGHSNVWEEILRVPLLVRFPDGEWAGDLQAPVQHVDLFPTLCSALGVEAPEGLQGDDLMPVLRGEESAPSERLRLARVGAKQNQTAVRFDDRWKVVFRESEEGELVVTKLFDLESDPDESRNLAKGESGKERARGILTRYAQFRANTAADDRRFASVLREGEVSEDELRVLRALGYAGEDE